MIIKKGYDRFMNKTITMNFLKNVASAKFKFPLYKDCESMLCDRILSFIDPNQYRKLRYSATDNIVSFRNKRKRLYQYAISSYFININNKALITMIPCCNSERACFLYEVTCYTADYNILRYLINFLQYNSIEKYGTGASLTKIRCSDCINVAFEENIPLESTILSKHKSDIYTKLDTFTHMIDKMYQLSLNQRTGFLFYGKPGTGKTKIALQMVRHIYEIANRSKNIKFSGNIITINAGNIDAFTKGSDDKSLRRCMYDEPAIRYIIDGEKYSSAIKIPFVLIDEIDLLVPDRNSKVYSDNKDLYDRRLSLLLKILELPGIFVATTNHIENLDPALIRTGRFDYKYEFDYFNHVEACQLCENYGVTPEECGIEETSSDIPPSDLAVDILNVLKKKTLQEEVV